MLEHRVHCSRTNQIRPRELTNSAEILHDSTDNCLPPHAPQKEDSYGQYRRESCFLGNPGSATSNTCSVRNAILPGFPQELDCQELRTNAVSLVSFARLPQFVRSSVDSSESLADSLGKWIGSARSASEPLRMRRLFAFVGSRIDLQSPAVDFAFGAFVELMDWRLWSPLSST